MSVQFAVNYSPQAVDLLRAGRIEFDLLKCPAWRDTIGAARAVHPVVVHFPLVIGKGIGTAINHEMGAAADPAFIESMLKETDTRLVNLHLNLETADYPDIPQNSTEAAHIERLYAIAMRDAETIVRYFGKDRVIVESVYSDRGHLLQIGYMPEFVRRVVTALGCGFLFDVAHARIAAAELGMDVYEYIRALPIDRVREMHIAGVQPFTTTWLERVTASLSTQDAVMFTENVGRLLDHLPMTDDDWSLVGWVFDEVRAQRIARPDLVALEYGGVGPKWQALSENSVLQNDVPRLREMVKGLR